MYPIDRGTAKLARCGRRHATAHLTIKPAFFYYGLTNGP